MCYKTFEGILVPQIEHLNTFFIILGEPPFMTFYIPMARVRRFLICIVTESSFQEVLQKSVVCRCILILDNVREARLFCYLMNGYDTSIQGGSS